jgi:hypothetical protein
MKTGVGNGVKMSGKRPTGVEKEKTGSAKPMKSVRGKRANRRGINDCDSIGRMDIN